MGGRKDIEQADHSPSKGKEENESSFDKIKLVKYIEEAELNFDEQEEVKEGLSEQRDQAEEAIGIFDEFTGVATYERHAKERAESYVNKLETKVDRLDTPIQKEQLVKLFKTFQKDVFEFNLQIIKAVNEYEKTLIIEGNKKINGAEYYSEYDGRVETRDGREVVLSEEEKQGLAKIDNKSLELKKAESKEYEDYESQIEENPEIFTEYLSLLIEKVKTPNDFKDLLLKIIDNTRHAKGPDMVKLANVALQTPEYTDVFIQTFMASPSGSNVLLMVMNTANRKNREKIQEAIDRNTKRTENHITFEKYKNPQNIYQKNIASIISMMSENGVVNIPRNDKELKAILEDDIGQVIQQMSARLSQGNKHICYVIAEVFKKKDYKKDDVREFISACISNSSTNLYPDILKDIIKEGKLSEITELLRKDSRKAIEDYMKSIRHSKDMNRLPPGIKEKFNSLGGQEKEILLGALGGGGIRNLISDIDNYGWDSIKEYIKIAKKLIPPLTNQEGGELMYDVPKEIMDKVSNGDLNIKYLERAKEKT